ncbi:hypothetical protein INR49_007161 [Caranx melampygus]|nr:hypothetical protein INR49_007161 [Caranx melampygus]
MKKKKAAKTKNTSQIHTRLHPGRLQYQRITPHKQQEALFQRRTVLARHAPSVNDERERESRAESAGFVWPTALDAGLIGRRLSPLTKQYIAVRNSSAGFEGIKKILTPPVIYIGTEPAYSESEEELRSSPAAFRE